MFAEFGEDVVHRGVVVCAGCHVVPLEDAGDSDEWGVLVCERGVWREETAVVSEAVRFNEAVVCSCWVFGEGYAFFFDDVWEYAGE